MKLIEADGKQLLRNAGIATLPGIFLEQTATDWPSSEPWPGPVMMKAQVLSGRRGQAGLIVRCEAQETLPAILNTLRERIGDAPCAGFLCEPMQHIVREWFVSVDVDRTEGVLRAAVSMEGGVGVSEAHHFLLSDLGQQRLPSEISQVVRQLGELAVSADALHVEINPYAQCKDGSFVALDAKVELDDAAAARHPEWTSLHALSPLGRPLTAREQAYEVLLKTATHRGTFGRYLELDGDIALILSGGGASLLALDAMHAAGGRAANYVEASGNPDPALLTEVARHVMAKPGLRGVWVAGSFANFTDIQATCRAICDAYDTLNLKIPLVIRRDGPNADEAERACTAWATERGIPFAFHRATTSLEASAAHLLSLLNV